MHHYQAMSDEQFSSYVQGVVDQKLEKVSQLSHSQLSHQYLQSL